MSEEAKGYYSSGLTKFNLADYRGALWDFNRSIQLDPINAEAYNYRGRTKGELGDNLAKLNDCERATQLNHNYAEAYIHMGAARYALGNTQDAEKDFDRAMQISPNNHELYYLRGTERSKLSDIRGAILDWTKAIELNSAYKPALQPKIDEARVKLEQMGTAIVQAAGASLPAQSLAPQGASAQVGTAQTQQSAPPKIMNPATIWLPIVCGAATFGSIYGIYAFWYYDVLGFKDFIEISIAYGAAVVGGLYGLHMKFAGEGTIKWSCASIVISSILSAFVVYAQMGSPWDSQRGVSGTGGLLEIITQKKEDDPQALYEKKNWRGLLSVCNDAISTGAGNLDLYSKRATANFNLGDYKNALEDYDKAIELNPKSVDLHMERGSARSKFEDYEGAIADFEEAIKIDSSVKDKAQPLISEAKTKIELQKQAAEERRREAKKCMEDGEKKYLQNDYKGAKDDWLKAMGLDPSCADALKDKLADVRVREEKEAEQKMMAELKRAEAGKYCEKANQEYKLKYYKEALRDWDKAIALEPSYKDVVKEDYEIAQGMLEAKQYIAEGDKLYNKKDYAGAIEKYEKAIELDPSCEDGIYNLKYAREYLEQQEKNKEKAQEYVEKGYENYRVDKYQAAIDAWSNAIYIYPPLKDELQFVIDDAKRMLQQQYSGER